MKFDDLDRQMRIYETAHDHCVLPGIYMVARIDGRNFTRLTKETCKFEAPFDERFRDAMLTVTEHLMACGFSVVYGYTQSDEISLLFSPSENAFGRKLRKFDSVLAGEASAKMSLLLGTIAAFDCRISQLPWHGCVLDYFRWRQEDAHRNALGGHCYWLLRKQGLGAQQATKALLGCTGADKNELLFRNGINFNDLPAWQKRVDRVQYDEFAAFVIAAASLEEALDLFQGTRWVHPEQGWGDWDCCDNDYSESEKPEENRHGPIGYGVWSARLIGVAAKSITEAEVLSVSYHAG